MNEKQLLHLLGEAINDKPSAAALESAYSAIQHRNFDQELAELIEDAQLEVVAFDQSATLPARVLGFQSTWGSVDLGIEQDQIEIEVRPAARKLTIVTQDTRWDPVLIGDNHQARAVIGGLSGPVRLEIAWGGHTVTTPWITI